MQWSGFVGRCASVELVWAREDGRGYQERYRVDGCWAEGAGARLVLADVAFRGAYGGGGVGGVSWACVGVGGCEVR